MKKVYLKTPEEAIKALKEGKEVRDNNDYLYKIIDGFIVSKSGDDGDYVVGDCVVSGYSPYVIEKEPLKFKVGRFYETRDHRKARCYLVDSLYCFFTIDNCASFSTNIYGYYVQEETSNLDIIGPWREEK